MPCEKACIEAELVGGAQVVGEANKIDAALGKVEKKTSFLKGAAKEVGGSLHGMASAALQAAGIMQVINLGKAIEDVKHLDLATAKLGQSAGVSGTFLREGFDKAEKKTLTSAVAMADLSRQLGRVTYDGKFAADSIATLGDEALAVGRDLGDELPLAAALRDMGVTAKRLPAELGRIRTDFNEVDRVAKASDRGKTAAGAGTATAGLAAAATVAGQIYAVSQLGEDSDQTGAKWRSKQANTIGAELAQQAIAAGDVTAVWGKVRGAEQQAALMEALLKKVDQLNATMQGQAALIKALLKKVDQLNATLQGQANAYAEAMGRKTIKVTQAPDPNASGGN